MMQKVEILLDGPDAEKCAELINDMAYTVMQHYKVSAVNIYCGRAPVKKGLWELQVPGFLCRKEAGKESLQKSGKADREEEQAYG